MNELLKQLIDDLKTEALNEQVIKPQISAATASGVASGGSHGHSIGVTHASGSYYVSSGSVAANTTHYKGEDSCVSDNKPYQSTSGKLPRIDIACENLDTGKEMTMTVDVEPNITPFESMLITQMLFVYQIDSSSFNAFEFVKANHLERHFKYA